MFLIVQLVGSALILAAFVAGQAGRMAPDSRRYLLLNFFGSLALAVSAIAESQWGFLVLEAAWCGVSFDGLRRRVAAR